MCVISEDEVEVEELTTEDVKKATRA